ncbi:MAG: c-type cytochrome [Nitrospira sp.]|nr:c-type cytochrome [Nitrospira sp.]
MAERGGSPAVSAMLLVALLGGSPVAWAAGHDVMRPRVPADKLAEARALRSPVPDSPQTIEQGKALYAGKGTCINCHGAEGDGNGPLAAQLNPAPRNFQHHGFWRHRTEGEIFWVIKHGSPGTSMIGFGEQLTDEEIWAIIQYERTFRRHHGMRGRGPMGHGGMRDSRKSDRGNGAEEDSVATETPSSPEKE